jgi:NADH-quinone oxidoreductase subunit D
VAVDRDDQVNASEVTSPEAINERAREKDTMTLNMGPQHPSTHGVLRLKLELDGEIVTECEPKIGYLHRGIEKMAEHKRYQLVFPWLDRVDYLESDMNNLGFALAVEKLLDIECPERGQWVRTIISEVLRMGAHFLWLGTSVMELGAQTVFMYSMRDRELTYDMMEILSGMRINTTFFRVGGMRADVPSEFFQKLDEFLNVMPERIDEYEQLLTNNPIFLDRTKGVGTLTAEEAIDLGVTGPNLRASGVNWDIRKTDPYCKYDEVDFRVPLGSNGDVFDRYLVRIEEMRQSLDIIEQCLESMPEEGPLNAEQGKVSLPSRSKMKTTMEGLIHHFKLVTEGFKVPPGEVYHAIESNKGEQGWFVVSDGTNKPHRVRVRPPCFVNLGALPTMCEGETVADVIANIGSLDIMMGEVDR